MEIFSSKFLLSFKNKQIKDAYEKSKIKKHKKFNWIQALIVAMQSLYVAVHLVVTHYFNKPEVYSEFIYYSSYVLASIICLTALSLILLITIKPDLNYKFQRVFAHFFSIGVFFPCIIIRIMHHNIIMSNLYIEFFIVTFEFFLRNINVFLGLMGFLDTFISGILTGVLHVIIWLMFYNRWNEFLYNFIYYYIFIAMTVIFSYFYHREYKISFASAFNLNTHCEWQKKMLNSSNTGLLKISNGKVSYLNRKVLEFVRKNEKLNLVFPRDESSSLLNDNEMLINDNQMIIMINANFKLFINEMLGIGDLCSSINFHILHHLKLVYVMKNMKDFSHLGQKTYNNRHDKFTLEVLYRFFKDNDNKDNFEFIFNDVTTIKKQTEFQYKSLFFSKIAHEFKNPLISINELADRAIELINDQKNQSLNLRLIKSISMYMLSLSKDLESFSQFQMEKEITLQHSLVDINQTILFVTNIVNGLLVRYNKIKRVQFCIIVDKSVPSFIFTDEIKFRQVLINLMSNSVKFTNEGSITLKITNEEKMIKVITYDTGIGMNEKTQKDLFMPFEKTIENNPQGAGLGMCIVKELTNCLGTGIQFSSQLNKGSCFWFKMPLYTINGNQITSEKEYNEELSTIKSNSTLSNNSSSQCVNQFNDESHHLEIPKATTLNTKEEAKSEKSSMTKKTVLLKNISLKIGGVSKQTNVISKRILIADDEPLVRQSTKRVIMSYAKKHNIQIAITEAEDGFELLNLITKHFNNNYDLIICDENMVYCGGRECQRQITRLINDNKLDNIPFILLTANLPERTEIKTLSKPLTEKDFKMIFEELD